MNFTNERGRSTPSRELRTIRIILAIALIVGGLALGKGCGAQEERQQTVIRYHVRAVTE